jgi:diacylglycerol kinase (ATP)
MKHIVFVINPNAGQKSVEEFQHTLSQELERIPDAEQLYKIETLIPDSPQQMRETLENQFSQKPADILGVVGGDGSIMEALPLLVRFPTVQLALIPYGTGNLLAANLGIPNNFTACLDTLFSGKARRIDMARINDSYFCLVAGIGVVADIMENTPREHKKKLGMLAYLINGVRTILRADRAHFTITTENRKLKAKGVAVLVSNAASFMGPCPPLTPDASPQDGLLDVCIIKSQSNRDYILTLMEVLLGSKVPCITDPHVIRFQTRRLKIHSSKRMKVQADGNVIGTTPVEIDLLRSQLQIIVPDNQPVKDPGQSEQQQVLLTQNL